MENDSDDNRPSTVCICLSSLPIHGPRAAESHPVCYYFSSSPPLSAFVSISPVFSYFFPPLHPWSPTCQRDGRREGDRCDKEAAEMAREMKGRCFIQRKVHVAWQLMVSRVSPSRRRVTFRPGWSIFPFWYVRTHRVYPKHLLLWASVFLQRLCDRCVTRPLLPLLSSSLFFFSGKTWRRCWDSEWQAVV